jgi:hypothetical protein
MIRLAAACAALVLGMIVVAPTAHADAVTASECKHHGGVVHTRPDFRFSALEADGTAPKFGHTPKGKEYLYGE